MSDTDGPVVLPPDDASVPYPIPWPDYVPPVTGDEPPPEPEEPPVKSTSKG